MQRQRLELNPRQSVAFIIAMIAITYLAASWAIDSGKILPHAIAFLSVYYGLYFAIELIKRRVSHDKKRSTRSAKKAH